MTVADLFSCVSLIPRSPVKWPEPVSERGRGVYVVALVGEADADCCAHDISYLPADEQRRWIEGEPVVYIGRTARPLSDRIGEFHRHKLGDSAPHSGGQAIKRLRCDLWVYWCVTEDDPKVTETALLEAFRLHTAGRLPFANRRR